MLWGSNAREAHPIFFHHVLKAVNNGAKLMVVDPRRTPSAQWADLWLGLDVGTDIPLANAIGARDHRRRASSTMEFVERATTGFDAYRDVGRAVDARGGRARHGRPGRGDPRARARVRRAPQNAQLCWTLGITEHHNAVDNVFALINLALLTGKVGR